jgi:hypothetical protein
MRSSLVLPTLASKALAFPKNIFLTWNFLEMLVFLQKEKQKKKKHQTITKLRA